MYIVHFKFTDLSIEIFKLLTRLGTIIEEYPNYLQVIDIGQLSNYIDF